MEIEIGDVIQEHYKGLECKFKGNPTDEAEFNANLTIYKTNGVEIPTWAKVQSYLTEMKTAYANNKYQRDRKPLYGTWEEQLDMMYHGTWKDHVAKVKTDIPKG